MKIFECSLILGEPFVTFQKTVIYFKQFLVHLNNYQTFKAILHCTVRKRRYSNVGGGPQKIHGVLISEASDLCRCTISSVMIGLATERDAAA